jgi:GntR family transcriptional regulator / MocR family aminotransferase
MREVYAERLSILIESARRKLTGLLELSFRSWTADGSLAATGNRQQRGETGCRGAQSGRDSAGCVQPSPTQLEGLQLGFAAVNGQEIRRGAHQLAIALEQLARPHL